RKTAAYPPRPQCPPWWRASKGDASMAKRLTLPSSIAGLIGLIGFSVTLVAGPNREGARITLEDLAASDGVATPTLSPSGREFAFTADGQIKLLPADGGWPVALTTTSGG